MEIIFAGGSHYGYGALKSIQKFFDKIYIVNTGDDAILMLSRPQDIIIDEIDNVLCPYVFLAGYSKLITAEQLKRKTYINVHGALLPKYRGMHSTFYAIMNGEENLGITFHLVNEYVDAGDILAQFSFPFKRQTVEEINTIIDQLVELNAGEVIYKYMKGEIIPQPQDDANARMGAKRNLQDCLLDFSMTNEMIERFFMALTSPYPRPLLKIRNEYYEMMDYKLISNEYYGPDGRLVFADKKGGWIKVKEGYLIVKKVRLFNSVDEYELAELVPIGYRFI